MMSPHENGPEDTSLQPRSGDGPRHLPETLVPPTAHSPETTIAHNAPVPESTIAHDTLRDPSQETLLPRVPGYEILGELGRGAMGVVYRAQHLALKRMVALKMILGAAGEQERVRFRTETEVIARLAHANIVQIYDVGEWRPDGTGAPLPYCALEFVDGGSLDRVIQATPQAPADSAELVRTLALAVHAAHEKNVVHRDLKPLNVLMSRRGEANADFPLRGYTPKVADFGLAKQLDLESGQTHSGAIMGTPSYMAPEQAEGRIDLIGPWTDSYALGAILYELLTGRSPFRGRTLYETLEMVRGAEPVSPRRLAPGVPRQLELVCLKALQKKPRSRYHSAKELADDLQRFLDGKPVQARPVSRITKTLLWMKRSPFQATALAASLALVVMGVALLFFRLESVQAQNELDKKDLVLKRKELDEQRRLGREKEAELEWLRNFETLRTQAEDSHRQKNGPRTMEAASAALQLLRNAPAGVSQLPRPDRLEQMYEEAKGWVASEEQRRLEEILAKEQRNRGDLLEKIHHEASFFATPFTGLELTENLARIRDAVHKGLDVFKVKLEGDNPPAIPKRYFNAEETLALTRLCCELLLVQADATAQLRIGEKEEAAKARLREALALLDRADRLGLGETYSSLAHRAACLEKLDRKDEAEKVRQKAAATRPTLAADYFLLALDRYRRGEIRTALGDLNEALKIHPTHYGARYLLAVCRLREKQYEAAREALDTCLKQREDIAWPRLLLGFVLMAQGDHRGAQREYEAIVQAPPDPLAKYVALVNRGVLWVKEARWEAGMADFEAAITLNPQPAAAYLNLAILHRQRADLANRSTLPLLGPGSASVLAPVAALTEAGRRDSWRSAVAALDRAIDRHDTVALLYQERARLHLRLGNFEKARLDLGRGIALAPRTTTQQLAADLLELARLMYEGGDHERAGVVLDGLLQLRPDHAMAWRLKGQTLLAQERSREAGKALDRYLELAPEKVGPRTEQQSRFLSEAYRARGLIHSELGDFHAAAECYTRGLEAERDPTMLSLRGWAYLMLGAPTLARPDFEEVLRRRPTDGDALLGRAEARVRLGDWKNALDDVERGLLLLKRTPRSLYTSARVHAQAYVRLAAGEKSGRTPSPDMERTRERAIDRLREALNQVPFAERKKFWGSYVERDPALASLSRDPRMERLAAQIRGSGE